MEAGRVHSMSLRVEDLAPGDRVVLNCPSSRLMRKRDAIFEGVFDDMSNRVGDRSAALMGAATYQFLDGKRWARFMFSRFNEGKLDFDVLGAFVVEPAGGLRDENGVRIFIERKMRMGQG
jgi:hypothetical protein